MTTTVTVVGLGKIGLPLAVQFARSGCTVIGADISERVVEQVNSGIEPFPGEAHLADFLVEVRDAGTLRATTDTTAAVAESDVVVIVVPLIVDDQSQPDFGIMDAATQAVGAGLKPGTLVAYETTLPVGTTRTRFAPELAKLSGLTLGDDLLVCFSPERVFSGRIFEDLRKYPKLIGGIDDESARRAREFYELALQFDERPDLDRPNGVWDLGSAEASELAKLAETTYRDINIGFANEIARYGDSIGIDARMVIGAANSQPFSHIHQPGIAVGGHCIPVYPRFYLAGDTDAVLPAAARTVNLAMPNYGVARLAEEIGDLRGLTVSVLGIAYRGGVKESAFSGVFGVVDALRDAGAIPVVNDPMYTDDEIRSMGFEPYALGTPTDAVVVQTDHQEYRSIVPSDLPGVKGVLDGRGIMTAEAFASADVPVIYIGMPTVR